MSDKSNGIGDGAGDVIADIAIDAAVGALEGRKTNLNPAATLFWAVVIGVTGLFGYNDPNINLFGTFIAVALFLWIGFQILRGGIGGWLMLFVVVGAVCYYYFSVPIRAPSMADQVAPTSSASTNELQNDGPPAPIDPDGLPVNKAPQSNVAIPTTLPANDTACLNIVSLSKARTPPGQDWHRFLPPDYYSRCN